MITKDTKIVSLHETLGWYTNIDENDTKEDYFSRVRGTRYATGSLVAERDNGTKHIFTSANYPASNLANSTVTMIDSYTLTDPVDGTQYFIVVGLDSNNALHVWAWDGSAFTEITRIFTATITGTILDAVGAVITTTGETENGIAMTGLPAGSFPTGIEGWIVVNASPSAAIAGSAGIVAAAAGNGAHTFVLSGINPGASGMNWLAGDVLTFYRTVGTYNASWNNAQGAAPHTAWAPNDTQRKTTLLYGSTGSPITPQVPLIVMRRPQRTYFPSMSNNLPLPRGGETSWYTENGGGLCTYNAIFGSKRNVKANDNSTYSTEAAASPDSTNYPTNSWLRIDATMNTSDHFPDTTHTYNNYSFVYVTVGYDDYQESDPVFKGFWGVGTPGDGTVLLNIAMDIYINPALMPKNVTQLYIYRYNNSSLLNSLGAEAIHDFLAAIGDDQLLLDRTVEIQWINSTTFKEIPDGLAFSVVPNDPKGRWAKFSYSRAIEDPESSNSVESNLSHAVVDSRSLITPRYAAKATKSQGAVVVVDENDATLRVSSYDGSGNNEDDNFPDLSVDSQGGKLAVFLLSEGELQGISINNDQIVALKRNTVEICDFQSSQTQTVFQIGCIAKRSILQTPYGLVWAGNSAIYFLPADGGPVQVLNSSWKNFYDGTLLTSNTTPTPYMNELQRSGIFAGWDPTYKTVWFAMTCATDDGTTTEQLIARCYFEPTHEPGKPAAAAIRWDTRQLGGFQATWLSRREESIVVGQPSGILFYPNMVGLSRYMDNTDNSSDVGTVGIPYKLRLIFGSLYSMSLQNVFTGLKIDHSTSGTGSYVVRLYGNMVSTPFDTKYFLVSENPHTRPIPPIGSLRYLKMEIELTSDVGNVGRLDISTIEFFYVPRPDLGQR